MLSNKLLHVFGELMISRLNKICKDASLNEQCFQSWFLISTNILKYKCLSQHNFWSMDYLPPTWNATLMKWRHILTKMSITSEQPLIFWTVLLLLLLLSKNISFQICCLGGHLTVFVEWGNIVLSRLLFAGYTNSSWNNVIDRGIAWEISKLTDFLLIFFLSIWFGKEAK